MFRKRKRRHAPNPIIYCAGFYILISLLLYVFTKRTIHVMMLWNLLLSLLPLFFAIWMCLADNAHDWLRTWLLAFLWLIFFPNAPYLVTDFIHLQRISFYFGTEHSFTYSTDFLSWLSLIQIGTGIFIGTCAGMLSLWIVHHRFLQKYAYPLSQLMMFFIFILSGFAMYIGRFLQLNSWDLFYPARFVALLSGHITFFSVGFSLLSACYICIVYYFFTLFFAAINHLDMRTNRWGKRG
ncbi:DUF1361 domain-containing protein [Sporolactobacillus shoreicorticis]|uniref:DUF1361 domain-containing protein n=1 Tax=Sporolactobacillus shoreicorticis TaxID=1923877 RepID=A0ABW5S6F7_9BACL|nr:DUF1361 domain-containing protein [Sporolactobacillus shoreicorticis]MCO7125724.1 DUF1361 domain-containing protein [Sporolactobacillus shoreicorticis]